MLALLFPQSTPILSTIPVSVYTVFAFLQIPYARKTKGKRKKMFIQIKKIRYYNVYIHMLKLSIKYFNLNITVKSHAEKVSMFTRQISDTRLSLL